MHKKTRTRLGHAYIYVYMNPPGPQQLDFSLILARLVLNSCNCPPCFLCLCQFPYLRSTASSTNIWSQFCHSKGGSK